MSLVSSAPQQTASGQIKAVLFLLALVLAMLAGYAYRNQMRYKSVAVHDEGKVYRAAWVEPDVMADLIERHGIRTVVNLCLPGEMGEHRWAVERETVRNAGARLLELPLPVTDELTPQNLQPHLTALAEPTNYPMLVHCRHGVRRTSQLLAIYDVCFRGKTADESLANQPTIKSPQDLADVQAFCRRVEQQRGELFPHAMTGGTEVMR